jgi:hypothetical protein
MSRAWAVESRTLLADLAFKTDSVQDYDNPDEALLNWAVELECSPSRYGPTSGHRLVVREVSR